VQKYVMSSGGQTYVTSSGGQLVNCHSIIFIFILEIICLHHVFM